MKGPESEEDDLERDGHAVTEQGFPKVSSVGN